jgi:PAS domain S-box-containing protein
MEAQLIPAHIMDSMSNGVIVVDASGRLIYINRQAAKILKLEGNKIMGAYIPDVLPMTGPLVIKCLETGRPQLGRHILGKRVKLVVNVTTIKPDERVLGAVCTFEGMHEFELAARKLESYKRLNTQLNAVINSSCDGIWVCDGGGKVISINQASEALNGIKAKDIIGKDVAAIVERGVVDRSVTMEVLEARRQASMVQQVRKTGRYLLVTGTPVFDEEGNISLVVVNERDMTQLNTMREKLEETRLVTEKFKAKLAELSVLELKKQEIVAESEAMRQVLRIALKLAHLGASNILILGESGTGKGLLAKFVHKNSKRKDKPFIQINCAALPETLLEAELFGYERGAFTGAREQGKVGLFELAHEGTLFLDEIGEIPYSVQAKLLKYLDDYEVMRLGGVKPKRVNCTIIAATNRDLEEQARQRRFRQDLFYRLNTFTIRIPPLRERREDIFGLANFFLAKYCKTYQLKRRLSSGSLELLQAHPFPGNVRELENLLKKAVVMSDKDALDEFLLRSLGSEAERGRASERGEAPARGLPDKVLAVERKILEDAMVRCKSTREIARCLGVSQPTVVRKLRKHGLGRESIH